MAISQYILDAKEQRRLQSRLRNNWMLQLRWFYLFLLVSIGVISSLLTEANRQHISEYIVLFVVASICNILLWVAARPMQKSEQYYHFIAFLQILLDLTLATCLIYSQGGLASRATIMYAFPIFMAGILFMRPAAYFAAAFSSAFYCAALVVYQHYHPLAYSVSAVLVPSIFYAAVFFILAALVVRFSFMNAIDERTASYSQLVAMLRHQLHHPTSTIAAITEMLEHSESFRKWPARDRTYLHQLKRENQRMNTMLTNILEAVQDPDRIALQDKSEVELVQLLNETSISCATAAKRLDDLRTDLPNVLAHIFAQPSQLRVAFDNIIENAFHYSQPGDPVIISLEREDNGAVLITIKDQGAGMTKHQQKLLFRLFTQLEHTPGNINEEAAQLYSMGLGLYVSKLIIERHGGTLELSSAPNKGTTVKIRL